MRSLVAKRVLITGGASGIGRSLAIRFAREGAEVHIADLNEGAADEVARAISATGGRARAWHLDVTDAARIADVRRKILDGSGPVDVLVNNAGIVHGGAFLDVPLDRHLATFHVNTLAVVAVTHAFLADLVARPDAHLVNIASAAGFAGLPFGDLCRQQVGRDRVLGVRTAGAAGTGTPPCWRHHRVSRLRGHGHVRRRAGASADSHPDAGTRRRPDGASGAGEPGDSDDAVGGRPGTVPQGHPAEARF